MKTKLLLLMALFTMALGMQAKKFPQIKFEKTTIDFGTFSLDNPVQKCTFKFKNVGDAKLVITAVHASCGCTVADYPKDFIAPGASGEITVTYDGSGKMPGPFHKNIQVFSNCKEEMSRIFIQGEMTDVPVSKKTNTSTTEEKK
ncbi:MAG: DUF1573 domain-containing protein [Bacteroidaceae bacterium]|nr:DUF1573 domain-containing protein [Bacteroidaceae bacterium]